MSKAEERALERFPVHEGASEEWIKVHLKNICGDYIEGYQQAEKDFTDAFIKKAVNYLDYKLGDIVKVRQPGTIIEAAMIKTEFIEEFKKAMKL